MAVSSNNLRVPFLNLPLNIQDGIMRKLSFSTFHNVMLVANLNKKTNSWVLPIDIDLGWSDGCFKFIPYSKDLFIYNPYMEKKSLRELESLCAIKLRRLRLEMPNDECLVEILDLAKRIGVHAEYIVVDEISSEQEDLFIEFIKTVKTGVLMLCAYSLISKNLLKTIIGLPFKTIHLSFDYSEEVDVPFDSFKSSRISIETMPTDVIIRFIKNSLCGNRPDDSYLLIRHMKKEEFQPIFEQFEDRLSILYQPELHEYSIYSHETRGRQTFYILISDFCYKTMWLFFYCKKNNCFTFERIYYDHMNSSYMTSIRA